MVPYNVESDEDRRSPAKSNQAEKENLRVACKEADDACKIAIADRDLLLVDFTSSPEKNGSPGKQPGTRNLMRLDQE